VNLDDVYAVFDDPEVRIPLLPLSYISIERLIFLENMLDALLHLSLNSLIWFVPNLHVCVRFLYLSAVTGLFFSSIILPIYFEYHDVHATVLVVVI